MAARTTLLAIFGGSVAFALPETACLTSEREEGDGVQLLQTIPGQKKAPWQKKPRVQCTYSLDPRDRCRGNECCPGAAETGWKRYPCPNAHPEFQCPGGAPKPISCGKMTVYGKKVCEQDKYCKWQVWKTQVGTEYPPLPRPPSKWTESCAFARQYPETCYPQPMARFNSSFNPAVPKHEWWQYQVPCDQPFSVPGGDWPANATLQTNSGWPNLGMDWRSGKSWSQLGPEELEAAGTLGWQEPSWQTMSVLSRQDPSMVGMFPATAFKYWATLARHEQAAAETLGWDERLWNWNALSMKGAIMFSTSWVPAVYVPWGFLSPQEQDGMRGLGWVGASHVNKVYNQDPGYGEGIPGQSWASSQCQDWDHLNTTAANELWSTTSGEDKEFPHEYLWKIYEQMLAPICPFDNPKNMTSKAGPS